MRWPAEKHRRRDAEAQTHRHTKLRNPPGARLSGQICKAKTKKHPRRFVAAAARPMVVGEGGFKWRVQNADS